MNFSALELLGEQYSQHGFVSWMCPNLELHRTKSTVRCAITPCASWSQPTSRLRDLLSPYPYLDIFSAVTTALTWSSLPHHLSHSPALAERAPASISDHSCSWSIFTHCASTASMTLLSRAVPLGVFSVPLLRVTCATVLCVASLCHSSMSMPCATSRSWPAAPHPAFSGLFFFTAPSCC